MNVIIVTACPSGVATVFLAARALERAARKRGWIPSVEMHSQLEPPVPLGPEKVGAADLVIVAAGTEVDLSRFVGKRVYQAPIAQALPDPDGFLSRAENEAKPLAALPPKHPLAAPAAAAPSREKKIVAVTACPTGVAHTFMAAEALTQAARGLGHPIRVETQGSVGAQNKLTPEEIQEAEVVILACDIEVDQSRFAGKRVWRTSTGAALKKSNQTIQEALDKAQPLGGEAHRPTAQPGSGGKASASGKRGPYRHLLTGVSFMLPMVVAGGLLIALSFVFGIDAFKQEGTLAAALMRIGGGAAFKLMVPLLAGYIAYSIADRPGIAPGMIGGYLASDLGAGFLGGIVAGFLAGYTAQAMSRYLKLPRSVEALKPILLIPLGAGLVTGLVMIYVIGTPVAAVMSAMTTFLTHMGSGNAVLLGLLLGAMMCFDLGGPVNKAAYTFGVGLLSAGGPGAYGPMAAIMASGMVPPLGIGLSSLLARSKFSESEREAGRASLALGLCFISEGAIPFMAKDPLRVIPVCMVGGAITGALSMFFSVQLMAPHGGLFVLLIPNAVNHVLLYLVAILVGSLVVCAGYALLKPGKTEMPGAESGSGAA
ncbi:PTS system D-fructose-specific IIB component (F1P-forming), Frc family /PTS system D-fructose-specific IIC component (F1P-forming), Frc family [Stigmatella aurantiaca]|uniref:protein-N(pi)-phosphohistidine--D-fructose phosphotransferase n=1 Tax=Stigmatella aurantiaca TaxID=41 RepID=A0A1H7J851_STIAU|nr:PTS fructose-like transporter subunit IIB [Stigmatella aurantiaca]SEK69375.1 PTS system D-fructose-specific IIB component (F1P-forming), Frc family /PTS system D-fructose-specific IIC component (F1P-forming), Frc family [Stigmatella aurantiaca]